MIRLLWQKFCTNILPRKPIIVFKYGACLICHCGGVIFKSENSMRVLLICPNYTSIYGSYRYIYRKGFLNPPLSLCYLAASLEQAGHIARIIDGEAEYLSLEEIIAIAQNFGPDLTALTATSIDFNKACKLAEALKQQCPKVPIVLGGTHVNIFGVKAIEQTPAIDFACIGDGEDLIVELVESLTNGAGKKERFDKIPGLIYREGNKVVLNSFRKIEENIDRYPPPSRHLLKSDLYYRAVPYRGYQVTAAAMSSRGCPFNCIFCAVKNIYGGTRVRLRSVENVLNELEQIVKEMGITHVSFNDDCLTINRKRMLAICEGIHKRDLKFTWEGLSRADLLDRELLQSMKDAGFVRISIGIESGNPEIMKVIKKQETLQQIEEVINIARELGIVTRGSVIIGNPYETRETIMDTFHLINKIKALDQAVINILQPYPGTEVREMVMRGEGGTRFVGDENSIERLQRFGSSSVAVNELTPDRLIRLQKYGFIRFYIRPRTIIRNLKITGIKKFIQDSLSFLRSIINI